MDRKLLKGNFRSQRGFWPQLHDPRGFPQQGDLTSPEGHLIRHLWGDQESPGAVAKIGRCRHERERPEARST